MVERILVPMDGSPLSKRALETALAEHPEAHVVVLHVIDPTEPGYSYPIEFDTAEEPLHGSEEWYERARELADELFAEARAVADGYGATVETETVVGRPDRVIVDYARRHDIDQIVIGGHARDEDSPILLGSVTEAVAFRAPVRVSIIR